MCFFVWMWSDINSKYELIPKKDWVVLHDDSTYYEVSVGLEEDTITYLSRYVEYNERLNTFRMKANYGDLYWYVPVDTSMYLKHQKHIY